MELSTRVWRDASLAANVEGFLDHVGPLLLVAFAIEGLVVWSLDGRRVEALGAIGRDRSGVWRPARVELDEAAATRLYHWARDGKAVRASALPMSRAWARSLEPETVEYDDASRPDRAPAPARAPAPVRGPARARDRLVTWMIPLPNHLGMLAIAAQAMPVGLEAVVEAIGVVAAKDHEHRELSRQREAAEAERAAALARLQVRDIGLAIIGADTGLRDVMRQVEQVAPTPAPVLIFGETGSGKEVVARAIHERSDRAHGPILRVNCGAIPAELVDSELFGHERGSFTGAHAQRPGWFERADGGTLFLDEIAELPLAAQVRLLRVVQDGVFERVGGTRALQVDVRVVAATHRDLAAMAEQGTFRADLWYRLNVFTIHLPPLRERLADIPTLAAHFAERAARRVGASSLPLGPGELALLRSYDWPGNVRELAAVIERAAILGEGRRLDIARALGASSSASSVLPTLDAAVRSHIERALTQCRGRIDGPRGAARVLAVNANTLRSKIAKLGIQIAAFRPE